MSPCPVIITTGKLNTGLDQPGMEVQPVHIGQTNIDNNAPGQIGKICGQKITGGRVNSGLKPDRIK